MGIPSVDGVIMTVIVMGCLVCVLYGYTVLYAHGPGAQTISNAIKKFDLNAEPLAVAMDASGAVYVKSYSATLPVATVAGGGVALATGTSFINAHVDGADDSVKRPQGGVCAM